MDHFGIGGGIAGAARTYCQASRRTGRTASLVASLKDGDRVVFQSRKEAQRVEHLCKDRGVTIETFVCNPASPDSLFRHGSPSGTERTVFDHSWVEQFYLNAIERAQREIDHLQTELSGRGAAHEETRRRAEELMKWDYR